ncbi:MAG: ParA family protein [Chloroflexota bacterium]
MAKVITVAHLRENTGKTITAIQFAYNLSLEARVLLLNFGRANQHKRFFEIEYISPLADYEKLLEGGLDFAHHLSSVSPRLWLIDSSVEKILKVGELLRERVDELKEIFRQSGFEWVIIDTHPFPTHTTYVSMAVCDYLMIPTTKDFLAFKTIGHTLAAYESVSEDSEGKNVSILLTKVRNDDLEAEDYERFELKESVIGEIPMDNQNLIELGWQGFYPGRKVRVRANFEYRKAVQRFLMKSNEEVK